MSLGVQVTSDDAAVSKLSAMTRGYIKDEFLPFFVRKAAKRSPLINRGACRGGGMAVAHAPRARTHTRLHIHTQEKNLPRRVLCACRRNRTPRAALCGCVVVVVGGGGGGEVSDIISGIRRV
jgi:hypothetical protein